MEYRALGKTGLTVSEIGFGAWQLGASRAWGAMTDREALALVDGAMGAGCTLFDTAPNYASTRSESLLGKALSGRRDSAVIVSKFGHRPEDDSHDFSVSWLWESLHQSLRRLDTDYVDVFLAHSPPAAVLSRDHDIWDALEEARRQGKVRHYGASVDRAAELQSAAAIDGLEVVEVLFNALQQDVRRAFPVARDRGLGLIAKVPLDSGWLGGRYDAQSSFSGIRGRWTPGDISRKAAAVEALRALLPAGQPMPEAALAYILSYDAVSSAIPGARSLEQLAANTDAAGKRLSPALKSQVEALWDSLTAQGTNPMPW